MILLAAAVTWLIPAGEYERTIDAATGRSVAVPGSYTAIPAAPVSPFNAIVSIPRGFAAGADVIATILFVGAIFVMAERLGTLSRFFGALAGFPHDVWLHTMGLIFSGAFDRFPELRLVIGHMGECLPLHLYRFDWMQGNADGRAHLRGGKQVKLKHPVSHYFQNNIWITTSGVAWAPAIKFCQQVLGADRVLYAMDYPYQQSYDEVAAYDRMDMEPEIKRMLMEGNARRVFNLP